MISYRRVELLAPAGRWDVLQKAAEAGADAVYVGGKRFNMRLLRPEFNFTDQELKDAVDYLHQRNKRLYVTVNNLYFDYEIDELKDYLVFLQDINVDALIIQDIAVLKLCKELQLGLPLHASVQMSIGNFEAANFLSDNGFSRVILSKNLSLKEIEDIYKKTSLDIEYFVHGDVCISHTGQCYMSSHISGKSSNRGQCIKPCRWNYCLKAGFLDYEPHGYYLAHNDLCLYPYLADLLKAGVSSLKIEGRMRSADYIAHLVSKYRKALDEIAANPLAYKPDAGDMKELEEKRIRNFTVGNLFGKPGVESVGITGEREPFFPTSAIRLVPLAADDYRKLENNVTCAAELSVKVSNIESFNSLCRLGLNTLILGYGNMRQNRSAWDGQSIRRALEIAGEEGIKVLLEAPRILLQEDMGLIRDILEIAGEGRLHGIIVNDYGSLRLVKEMGFRMWGGSGLNVTNSLAAKFLIENGLERITASQELQIDNLETLLASGAETEVMVHGPLCGIITDFCIARAVNGKNEDNCKKYCLRGDYALYDDFDQEYLIRTDHNCRNYIFYPYDLCLFPYLPFLISKGARYMRIDGQYYDTRTLLEVVRIYREALEEISLGKWEQEHNYHKLLEMFPQGLTAAPLFSQQ